MKIYSCVEVIARKVKRQCRTFNISAERNTSARITDDISLLNWTPHFAMRFLNKMGTGEEELISFVKRIIQGMFVCHHDRTRTSSHITKSGIVRGKSWTRQILSDAWESTNWEDLFHNPLHSVIAETKKMTEKFIEDEEGTDLLLPRMLVKKPLEVEHRKLYIVYAGTEAHGHIGSCLGYALLTLHGKVTKPRKDEFRERVGTIIERTLAGEARMETYKDRMAERKRVREKRRARLERGAVDA